MDDDGPRAQFAGRVPFAFRQYRAVGPSSFDGGHWQHMFALSADPRHGENHADGRCGPRGAGLVQSGYPAGDRVGETPARIFFQGKPRTASSLFNLFLDPI